VLIVVLEKPPALALSALSLFVLFLLLRPPAGSVKTAIWIMGIAFAGTVLSQGFFYGFEPKTPLLTILPPEAGLAGRMTGGIALYREGLSYGAVQALRLFCAMLVSTIIVMTTYPSDLILGLKRLGLPDRIGFMSLVSLRFLPALFDEARRIILAQRLRGLRTRGVRGAFRAFRFLLSPLIIDSLRTARRIALAAEVRAYTGRRTTVRDLAFSRADHLVLVLLVVIVVWTLGQRL
jgi:energy-coupling factor transport system permease protein